MIRVSGFGVRRDHEGRAGYSDGDAVMDASVQKGIYEGSIL